MKPESDYDSEENQDDQEDAAHDDVLEGKEEQEQHYEWPLTFEEKPTKTAANKDVLLTTNFVWRPKISTQSGHCPAPPMKSLKRKTLNVDISVEETITAPVSPNLIKEEMDKKFAQAERDYDKEATPISSLGGTKEQKVSS